MRDIIKAALSFVGPAFALLLLGFTGYQTFTLIQAVTGSPIIAAIGLILFEGGMMYWWFVFRSEAEGLPQMALSLMVFVTCLVFVVMATALKLGAVGDSVLGASTPAKIITAAAVVQLAAKLVFPLLHPEVSHAIKERSQEGKIIAASDRKFDAKVDGIADTYADARADVQVARLLTSLNTKHGTQYQLPGAHTPVVIEGQTTAPLPAAPQEEPAAAPGIFDRLFNRSRKPQTQAEAMAVDEAAARYHDEPVNEAAMLAYIQQLIDTGQLSVPLSNSTHDAMRQAQAPQPQQGQGERPRPNGPSGPTYGPENFR